MIGPADHAAPLVEGLFELVKGGNRLVTVSRKDRARVPAADYRSAIMTADHRDGLQKAYGGRREGYQEVALVLHPRGGDQPVASAAFRAVHPSAFVQTNSREK